MHNSFNSNGLYLICCGLVKSLDTQQGNYPWSGVQVGCGLVKRCLLKKASFFYADEFEKKNIKKGANSSLIYYTHLSGEKDFSSAYKPYCDLVKSQCKCTHNS